jgi:hypothetical protein
MLLFGVTSNISQVPECPTPTYVGTRGNRVLRNELTGQTVCLT